MLWSLFLTASYVAVLYIHRRTRPSLTVSRDDPRVIRDRIGLISGLTVVVCWMTRRLYHSNLGLGMPEPSIWTPVIRNLPTVALFVGPIFQKIVEWDWNDVQFDIYTVRNYIIGPATEELVFRACLIDSLTEWSDTKLVLVSPLFFGIAHVHHCYESYLHKRTWKVIIPSIFQFAYTTIFGWYAAYLYVSTGSVYTPLVAHIFCNWMGFPDSGMDEKAYDRIYKALLLVGPPLFTYTLRAL